VGARGMSAFPSYVGQYPTPREVSFLTNGLVEPEAKVYCQSYWDHLVTGSAQPDLKTFEKLTASAAQQIRLKLATLI
jgi:hypothetical protein